MKKKLVINIIVFSSLIIAVLAIVFFNVGITFDLEKVMPNYRVVIYSQANLYNFDKKTLESADKQLEEQINKIKIEEYAKGQYLEKGLKGILLLNRENLVHYIASYSEATKNEYQKLPKTDYYDYLREKQFNYNKKRNTNDLHISLDMSTAVDKGIYYEVDAAFYRPVTIEKANLRKLKVDDIYVADFPIATTSNVKATEKVDLKYIGDDKFNYTYKTYVINEVEPNANASSEEKQYQIDEIYETVELNLKAVNDKEFAFYLTETERIELFDSEKKVCILKDATISYAYGSNFLIVSNVEIMDRATDMKYGLSASYKFKNLFLTEEENKAEEKNVDDTSEFLKENEELAKIFNTIYMNYILYDNKGYITDIYNFRD